MPSPDPRGPSRAFHFLPLAAAAVSAVLAAQLIGRDPRFAGPLLALVALSLVPRFVGRWRMRRLLRSGDVERVIGTWAGSIDRVAHRETMGPLLHATAYAAYGRVDAARRALDRAVKGPAWDAAIEQRLFVETLLDTFEGDRAAAVRKAQTLEALPVPAAGHFVRRRVALLRHGLSPLVHWAMRYASAIVALDDGRVGEVEALLAGAPAWPEESAFHEYHRELLSRAEAPST
jgi:hypothetical protein